MDAIIDNLGVFWEGFLNTLLISVLAGAASLVAGVVLASFSISPIPLLRRFTWVYVNLMRNIPAAVHLFFAIFILPVLGVKLPFFTLAFIGLTIYFAAYYCDAVTSGLNAIAPGQLEAARAMGLRKAQTMRLVVLPQGLRNSVPPLINTTIALIKATAIAGVFGVIDLFGAMLQLINTNDTAVIPLMVFTGILYAAITIPAGLAAAALERRVVFSN